MKILSERKYRIPLHNNTNQRKYLEQIVTELNNAILDDSLTPADKCRYVNSILVAIKTTHEIQYDSELQDLAKRLEALEKTLVKS